MTGIAVPHPTPLSASELAASIDAALAAWNARTDLWLFAYGSLMWNPLFPFRERVCAHIFGYHRRFCLWSRINRGTPENPGLVLALTRGGSCRGFAYRIARDQIRSVMPALWQREMIYGSYQPSWLPCHLPDRVVPALAFVINPLASGFTGKMSDVNCVRRIANAAGRYGTAAEYLFRTVESLDALGIVDGKLHALADKVRRAMRR
jgi:cation transport protein ChaC